MERKRKLDVYEGFSNGAAKQPTVNPYTGRVYSAKYYEILEKRQGVITLS